MLITIQNIDWAILHKIRAALSCRALDFIMPRITLLGNGGAFWIIAGFALLLATLAAGALIGNVALKHLAARSRPCWLEEVDLLIKTPRDYSFPSGHTLASVIGAMALKRADRRFGYFAIPLAVLIAFSRLYLFVHFPSDVLASVVLGCAIAFPVLLVGRRLTARWETQVPKTGELPDSGKN